MPVKPNPAALYTPENDSPTDQNLHWFSGCFQVYRQTDGHHRVVVRSGCVAPVPFKSVCLGFTKITQEQLPDLIWPDTEYFRAGADDGNVIAGIGYGQEAVDVLCAGGARA